MTNLKVILALVTVLISVTSLSHVAGQSTDVPATAIICSIDIKAYNSTDDYNNDMEIPASSLSFGTLEHGQRADTKKIFDILTTDDNPVTLRIFGSDWVDFDGNFVMNGNQTHVSPRINDGYAFGFPLNSTGQYAPAGEGILSLPVGSLVNDARDGIILPTQSSTHNHFAVLTLRIPDDATQDPNTNFVESHQGSIHQDVTLQFEC